MKTNSVLGPEVASGVDLRMIDSQTLKLSFMKIQENDNNYFLVGKKLKKNSNMNTFDSLLDLVQPVSSSVLGPTWSGKSNHEV